jgi:hypothetical protein
MQESPRTSDPSPSIRPPPLNPVFGAPYANELGNRPLFGLVVNGNGTQVSINELGFSASSNDPGNLLGFAFGTGSYNYSSNYVGIILGGGPTFITSGPNTQLVDEIVGRGSGNAFDTYCPGCTIAQQQSAIDALASNFDGMTAFAGTYTLTDSGGSVLATGSGAFDVAPEPASFVLVGAAMVALGIVRRKLHTR